MKRTILFSLLLIGIVACKKNKQTDVQPQKIYWGNAIYNSGIIIRNASNYQACPDTLKRNGAICLIPKHNDYTPYDQMIIGDTIIFSPIMDQYGLCYLNNITNKVEGTFTSTTNVQLVPVAWNGNILLEGTITLNMDNSIDIEYTDLINDGSGHSNHYIAHYIK